ncbi:MAG: hypothetical protein L3J25_05055 [Flavobacteriaceae bacterium]|nr:hypothetical protein [Flavobacteriaceae bacterium]
MEGKNWYDIILANWAQIVFLLGSLGVLFTAFINWRYKVNEIRYSKLHENKIVEIKAFYKSFLDLETKVKKYFYQVEFGQHSDEIFDRIWLEISEATLSFEYHSCVVRLFLKDPQIKIIEELIEKIESIREKTNNWLIHKGGLERKKYDKGLSEIGQSIIPKEIPNLLKMLEIQLKKDLQ